MSDTDLVRALSEEVRCNICLELFEDPRVLDCLHTFCLDCISQVVKRSQGRSVVDCPLCRNVTFLGSNSVNGLKKNHYLANISDKLKETIKKGDGTSNSNNNTSNTNNNNNNNANASYPPQSHGTYPIPTPNNEAYPNPSAPPFADATQNTPPRTSPYLPRHTPPRTLLSTTPPQTPPTERNPPPPRPVATTQPYLTTVTSFFSNLLYGTRSEPPQPPAHMPPEEFSFLQYTIPMANVPMLFTQWVSSLWLLPSDFSNQLPPNSVTAMYVPYWVYDVTVNTKCSAKVSRTDADPRDNGRAAAENWINVDTSYMHVHNKLMICAAVEDYEPAVMGLVEQLDWKLEDANIRSQPGQPLDMIVVGAQGYDVIWHGVAEQVIRNKEREKCEFDLTSQPLIAHVKEITLEINFLNVTHRLVHFPVYVATYTYGESTYKWVCNGVTGVANGNRPYGLGKLADLSKKGFDLVSGLFSKST